MDPHLQHGSMVGVRALNTYTRVASANASVFRVASDLANENGLLSVTKQCSSEKNSVAGYIWECVVCSDFTRRAHRQSGRVVSSGALTTTSGMSIDKL